jgi:hypothetical protein
MNLTTLQRRRFEAAKALIAKLKDRAARSGAVIMFDGEEIRPEQIIVSANEITVAIDNCSFGVFDESSLDESIEQCSDYLRRVFAVVIKLNWWMNQ